MLSSPLSDLSSVSPFESDQLLKMSCSFHRIPATSGVPVFQCRSSIKLHSPSPLPSSLNLGPLQQRWFVVLSILFSVHPLADVCRTVLQLHPAPLATP